MTAVLLIICLVILIIPLRKTKFEAFMVSVAIAILICVFALNNNSSDQYAYSILYKDSAYFSVEEGYLAITGLANNLGLSYTQFKVITMFGCFLLLFFRIKNYPNLDARKLILLWGLTSYWFDIEQSRYMIAVSIVIFATKYLEEKKISNLINYILLVFLAFKIHTTMIAFISLLLVYFDKNFLKILAICSCLLTGILVLGGKHLDLIGQLIYSVIPNKRILMWFSFSTNWGWLGPCAIQFFIFLLLYYEEHIVANSALEMACLSEYEKTFLELIKKIYTVSFLFLPMYIVSTEFLRLIRAFFLLFFASISIYYSISCAKDRLMLLFLCSLFVVLFNLQGLNGILFYNDYFINYMILKNDINSSNEWILFFITLTLVVYLVLSRRCKASYYLCRMDFDRT